MRNRKKHVSSLRFRLKVFIWRHVVYMLESSTALRGILICGIYRPTDMQECFLYVQYCIIIEITVLYLKNYRFNGRKYPSTGSANASPVNSICDNQITN